jgi:hypothetical protein
MPTFLLSLYYEHYQTASMNAILAIDLGKYKSVACVHRRRRLERQASNELKNRRISVRTALAKLI